MNKRWTATLVLFAAFGGLAAAGGTATDQAVSLTYSASHWGTGPGADLTGVDATGDAVYQLGIWYRAEGDTEARIRRVLAKTLRAAAALEAHPSLEGRVTLDTTRAALSFEHA